MRIQTEQKCFFFHCIGQLCRYVGAQLFCGVQCSVFPELIQLVLLKKFGQQFQKHRCIFADSLDVFQILDVCVQHTGQGVECVYQIVSDRIGVYSRQSVEQQQFQYFMRLKAFQSAEVLCLSAAAFG